MGNVVLQEQNYKEEMIRTVEPYLLKRETVLLLCREPGKEISCVRYQADRPKGVVMISHGFTETAEKYKENIYYLVKAGYHVYMPEHCGHGHSYRLTADPSLVHIDNYRRYVEDFLFTAHRAKEENPSLPFYLYGHSMGGGIAAAVAAEEPELFQKLILSSPMIRPSTGRMPWVLAGTIAAVLCAAGKQQRYVLGQKPYQPGEKFEDSSSGSEARFQYYQEKRRKEPLYQLSAPSYGWLYEAGRLNRYLQKKAWKKISIPILVFQADREYLVSTREQERFLRKLVRKGVVSGKLIRVPGTKHEIFNSEKRIVEGYWRRILTFLEE
ncbi:MAG TPA: alpha/beta hydrolase [Lachnospiraceae bacterium]|nr:alpha/beta hydrolase [Lachnospiraceae bacterium]